MCVQIFRHRPTISIGRLNKLFRQWAEDWYPFVKKRKIDVEILQTKSKSDVIHQLAWEHLQQQKRESMSKRFQLLNQLCMPRLKGQQAPTAWIKLDALEEFDELRHKIIHGRYFNRPIRAIEEQLHFAKMAGLSAIFLVASAYGLLKGKYEPKSTYSMLRLCVVFRREFPEFVELINQIVAAQIQGDHALGKESEQL
jgi:hypothetical protein